MVLDPDTTPDLADAVVTDVVDTDLDEVELVRCVLEGVRLTGRQAHRLRLVDVVLRGCELSGADLSEAQLTRVRIEGCRAEGLDLGLAKVRDLVVVGSKLSEAGLRSAELERVRFDDCDLRRSEWQQASVAAASVIGCDLSGAHLGGARLRGVRFAGTRLDDLRGATALAGASIGPDQVVPVAVSLFSELGIALEDDDGADGVGSA